MTDCIQALAFDHAAPDTSATRVRAIPRPRPLPGQVSIAVTHAGVNFKDVMCRRGDPGYVVSWPHVPGLEVAGMIAELGAGVTDLHVGEPVVALTNDGGLAEIAVASAALTVSVPEGLSLGLAAAAPGALTTAALLLEFAHLGTGEALMVHSAAGAVGRAVAQIARNAGASFLVGTVGHESRRELALAHGYDQVIVRDEHLEANARVAGATDYDVILDPQGTKMLDVDLALAAAGARILVFGNAAGDAPEPLPSLPTLFAKNASVGAFSLKGLSINAPMRVRAAIKRVLTSLQSGGLSVPITYLPGLTAVADAQEALAQGRGAAKYIAELGI